MFSFSQPRRPSSSKRGARSPRRAAKSRHRCSSSRWFFRGSMVPRQTKYGASPDCCGVRATLARQGAMPSGATVMAGGAGRPRAASSSRRLSAVAAEFTTTPSAIAETVATRAAWRFTCGGRAYSGWLNGIRSWTNGTNAAPARRSGAMAAAWSSARWDTSRNTLRPPVTRAGAPRTSRNARRPPPKPNPTKSGAAARQACRRAPGVPFHAALIASSNATRAERGTVAKP